ncbi:hypothetical protein AAC387_Pa03g1244 [Persea americana]
METKKEGLRNLQSAGSMYPRMYGASPVGENSCRSSKFCDSEEEEDDAPLDFQNSNSNLPPCTQNFSYGALDLDLCPMGHESLVDTELTSQTGPFLDHGLEDGLGSQKLVEGYVGHLQGPNTLVKSIMPPSEAEKNNRLTPKASPGVSAAERAFDKTPPKSVFSSQIRCGPERSS